MSLGPIVLGSKVLADQGLVNRPCRKFNSYFNIYAIQGGIQQLLILDCKETDKIQINNASISHDLSPEKGTLPF